MVGLLLVLQWRPSERSEVGLELSECVLLISLHHWYVHRDSGLVLLATGYMWTKVEDYIIQ